jgi:hypothetical protein
MLSLPREPRISTLFLGIVLVACAARDDRGEQGSPPSTDEPTLTVPLPLEQVDFAVVDNTEMVHHKGLIATYNRPVSGVLTCAQQAGDDTHRVEVQAQASSLELDVFGLLADSTYGCILSVSDGTEDLASPFELEIGPIPDDLPEFVITGDTLAAQGWTLVNVWHNGGSGNRLMVFDPLGHIRWYRWLKDGYSPGVGIDANFPLPDRFLVGGGPGYPPAFFDRAGRLLYHAEPSEYGEHHHHAELLPSGEILSLTEVDIERDGLVFRGFTIEVRSPEDDSVTWSWHSEEALDQGILDPPTREGSQPWHANSVSFVDDPHGEAAWVSLMLMHRILRIDRATGVVTHQLGPEGDFTLLDPKGRPEPDAAQWFYNQHDPEFAWPLVLLHDNGTERPVDEPFSRVLELELDLDALTAKQIWTYTEQGWQEPLFGDADRLQNGHVLIAQGHSYDDGKNPGTSAVVQVDPATGQAVWRADFPDPRAGLYRAERIDGCALLTSERWCTEAAP